MRIPFLARPPREFSIEPLSARIAARRSPRCIARISRGRGPTASSQQLLAQDTVFGFAGLETGKGRAGPVGFVLARLAAGEAEILTLAVARSHRRARAGLAADGRRAARTACAARRERCSSKSTKPTRPAIALYRRFGFREVGKRPRYYQSADGARTGALVMRRDLR